MFGKPDRVEKPVIVIAGNEEEYVRYLKDNHLTPREAVFVIQGYQLEELPPDCEVVKVGTYWLNQTHGSEELGKFERSKLRHQDEMTFGGTLPRQEATQLAQQGGVEMRFGQVDADSPLMVALKKIVNSDGNVGELKTIAANAIRDNS